MKMLKNKDTNNHLISLLTEYDKILKDDLKKNFKQLL